MWCERVLYNLAERAQDRPDAEEIDYLDLTWDQCSSVIKKRSRCGNEVRVLLPPGCRIRHDDVLHENNNRLLIASVIPTECVVAGPAPSNVMLQMALELGNLHWPTQIQDARIIFPRHERATQILDALKIPSSVETVRFEPAEIRAIPAAQRSTAFQVIRSRVPSVA